MNKVLNLSIAMLKNSSNLFFTNKKGKRTNKKVSKIFAIIGLSLVYLYVAGITGFMFYAMTAPLVATGEAALLSPIMTFLLIVLGLFFGMVTMFSMFFTASDNYLWLPLPFKIKEIFSARFITTLVFLFIVESLLIVPAFIGFNIAANPGVLSMIAQLVVMLAIPILILSLSFILILGLSRLINIQKHRKIFQFISASLVFIFSFGISFLSSSSGQIFSSSDDLAIFADSIRSVSKDMDWLNFLTFFTDGAFSNLGFVSLLLPLALLAIALVVFFIAYFLSSKAYHASLYSVDISKKKKIKGHTKTELKVTKPIFAFFKNEVKTIFRSPTYFFNLIIPIVIVLVITVVSTFAGFASEPELDLDIQVIFRTIFDPSQGMIFIIGLGVIGFFCMMNLISATAITREGSNAQLLKIYPVSTREMIYGKMLLGLIVNFAVMTPFIITLAIIGQANVFVVLAYIIGSVLVSLVMNYCAILIDCRFPMLNWTNEIEAVKNNKNILITMGVNFVINGLIFLPLIPVIAFALPVWAAFLIFVALFSLFILIFELIIKAYRGQLLSRIQ